jgi:hypothetical protein
MTMRPEILGTIGLVVAALASLGLWLRQLWPITTSGEICPRCGTMQPLPSRPTVLARHIFGRDTCVSCGHKLERRSAP